MTSTATTPASSALTTGTWTADTVHSDVAFKVRHMAVGKAKGTFALTSATLTVGADGIASASVVAVIDAASVVTKNADRDAHVRSADFLDTDNFPTMTFASTQVKDFDGETFSLLGDLTLHGVTKAVTLETEYLGETVDAYGATRTGFSAHTSINRKDFGISIEMGFGAGNAVVADKIEISLELEFVKDAS
ncbi:polyisoprenoid-binding protein [Nakamurella antarctica]|uniref:Polyisoprenoid-binding protein n=1 Tax=Nakamurella antarctica TaxID=1902245 RepID=A0A3G8ZJF2_9ACTN|nr:YceI family protein [Nakamurella antarctica]AZI57492.1 polyisoprenoid-binding protein [Nakamurella antarctica]